MSDGQDRIIAQVRATLREAPEAQADPRAVAQLLSAVWASPRPTAWRRFLDAWRVPALSGLGASAVAAFALFAGFLVRGSVEPRAAREPMMATGEFPSPTGAPDGALAGGVPVIPAAAMSGESAPVAMQFVLDRADARSVSLVGDFNDWQGGALPLTRLESGLWTVTVPLAPGRHVYAFLVDGTLMVADPRAPKAGDADYGREGSVVMVFAR
jgi:Carbohydrate-binding module 48 (Isoamylase N-terminal domain)